MVLKRWTLLLRRLLVPLIRAPKRGRALLVAGYGLVFLLAGYVGPLIKGPTHGVAQTLTP